MVEMLQTIYSHSSVWQSRYRQGATGTSVSHDAALDRTHYRGHVHLALMGTRVSRFLYSLVCSSIGVCPNDDAFVASAVLSPASRSASATVPGLVIVSVPLAEVLR